jgi:hypothetical protein
MGTIYQMPLQDKSSMPEYAAGFDLARERYMRYSLNERVTW